MRSKSIALWSQVHTRQEAVDAGLRGYAAYQNDIIVSGMSFEEHSPCPLREDRRVWISCPIGEKILREGDQVSGRSD